MSLRAAWLPWKPSARSARNAFRLTSPSPLVNHKVLQEIAPEAVEIRICRVEALNLRGVEKAEVDEMQNFVGKKSNQRWLWHAIEHHTGQVLAFVLGSRQDKIFLELKRLLEPFGIKNFYTDKLGTYERHLASEEHQINKYKMQKIERKHLTLRTKIKRLQRKTICFSKSISMHDTVIGLYINRYEFGLKI